MSLSHFGPRLEHSHSHGARRALSRSHILTLSHACNSQGPHTLTLSHAWNSQGPLTLLAKLWAGGEELDPVKAPVPVGLVEVQVQLR